MIAIFKTQADAKAYADKVHEYLSDNCPRYNAEKWDEPKESKDRRIHYVKTPREMQRDYYPVKTKISSFVATEIKKSTGQIEKIPKEQLVIKEDVRLKK